METFAFDFQSILSQLLQGLFYITVFFLLLLGAKWLKHFFSSYDLDEELVEKDNTAIALSYAGYCLSIAIIFVAAYHGSSKGFGLDALEVIGYSLGGILLLNLSREINNKFILTKFPVRKELIEDQNAGTGIVEAAVYISSALVIAGAIYGEGGGPLSALIFFLIGQIGLILFAWIYERMIPYSFHHEIEQDNVAAGTGFSGGLISIGIIIMGAISGDVDNLQQDILAVVLDLGLVILFLIILRFILDRIILRRSNLLDEITRDQNLGAGILEMVLAISFATVLFFMI
ncbi:MAG: DUF350 domain-containing protein [Bacteroidota bacterium]